MASALTALRMDRGAAVLLGATTALVLASLLPVSSLMGARGRGETRLEVSTVRGGQLGLPWSDPRTPAETQRVATTVLFGLLVGMATATLATGAITIVAVIAARDAVRSSDDAVRRAVGASRRTLRNAALLEASAIAAAAVGAGVAAGTTLSRMAVSQWPGETAPYRPDASVALVSGMVALLVFSAILPVIFARQGRLVEADRAPRAIFGPAVAQFAASLAVLVTAALVGRSAAGVASMATPGRDAPVLQLASATYDPRDLAHPYDGLLQRLHDASLTASLTSPGAAAGLGMIAGVTTDCGNCSEGGIPSRFHVFHATHHLVSPDSFQALGIHLVQGRQLRSADRSGAERVAVVNRVLAQRHFERAGAIGRKMIVGDDKEWSTVVGIVDDAAAWGFGSQFQPRFTVYLSILQHPAAAADLLVQDSRAAAMLGSLDFRITETTVSRLRRQEAAPLAWFGRWIAVEGWATMLIAAVGMFAVMRIWVRSLLPEIGLRRGLGATRTRVMLLVVRQVAGVAAAGVAAGCWFGWSVWNVLPTIIRGSATWDTRAVAAAALPLFLATFAGGLLPALQAVRRNPADLLSSTG